MLEYKILNAKFEDDKASYRYQREGCKDIYAIVSTAKPQPELVKSYHAVILQIVDLLKKELRIVFSDISNIHNVFILETITVSYEESKIDRSSIMGIQFAGRIRNTLRKCDYKIKLPKLYETELFLNMPKEYLLPVDLVNCTYDLFSEICDYINGARAQQEILFPDADTQTIKEMVKEGSLKIETVLAGEK